MAGPAIDLACLTRIAEFTPNLHRLHQDGDDDAIDREFNAVCKALWGYCLDDFTDEDMAPEDLSWLDRLTRDEALDFAVRQGYDLTDPIHGGCVTDWWGFAWMILAEARGLLTPERRAAAWRRWDETLLAEANVVAVIRGR